MGSTARNTDPRALRSQAFIAESVNCVKTWIAPLNVTGKRIPMFFVFPMSLDGACYVRLSAALGEDQPFYAFQIPSKDRNPGIATSVPDIARCLIAEFEQVCREGQFILGGWSAGAIIALEMAQQLTRKGRPPALLAPIDHAPFNTDAGVNPFHPVLLNDVIRLRALWRKSRDEEWKPFIPSPATAIAQRISTRILMRSSHIRRKLCSWQVPMGPHPIQKTIDDARGPEMRELLKTLYRLLIEYRPSKYDGPVLLFLSAQFPDFEFDRKWSTFARDLKIRHFLGTPENPTIHESFIRGEHVDSFARVLKAQIDLLLLQGQSETQRVAPALAVSGNSAIYAEQSSL